MTADEAQLRTDRPRTLQAELEITAPVADVWRVVSDLRRTPEWSPECRKVLTLGPVRAGSHLIGVNRRGLVLWATHSRIRAYRPLEEISWDVATNGAVWTYRLTPTATGTLLTETRALPRGIGPVTRAFAKAFLGGADGHDDELEHGMTESLRRIRTIVEAG